jgi:CYTH domain-containing protein
VTTLRHFLIAPSLARLIQRERGTMSRIVEGHFPSTPGHRPIVRVEQSRALLILVRQGEDGRWAEEGVPIPLPQAEALLYAVAGLITFDRTSLPLGDNAEAVLDRFILPEGLDILTVTIFSNPRAFAPPPWFGLEVTDEPAYEAAGLALRGAPHVDIMEPSKAGLEALLNILDGRSPSRPDGAGFRLALSGGNPLPQGA